MESVTVFSAFTNLIIFVAVATAGMLSHYFKLSATSVTDNNILQYFFVNYKVRSILAFFSIVAGAYGMYQTGMFMSLPVEPLVLMAITYGYTADSLVNKGTAPTGVEQPQQV